MRMLIGGEMSGGGRIDNNRDIGNSAGRVGIEIVDAAAEMNGIIATAATGKAEGLGVGDSDGDVAKGGSGEEEGRGGGGEGVVGGGAEELDRGGAARPRDRM